MILSAIRKVFRFITQLLCAVSLLLRVIWLFFPSLLFLILAMAAFWMLPQGTDIIRLCLEGENYSGQAFMLATVFWVFVTWYTGRLVAYNHPHFFEQRIVGTRIRAGEILLYHFPRLMAYSIFMVLIVAIIMYDDADGGRDGWWLPLIGVEYLLYGLFHLLFERIRVQRHVKGMHVTYARLNRIRQIVTGVIIAGLLLSVVFWGQGNVSRTSLVIGLVVLQLGFLFLVITRREAALARTATDAPVGSTLMDKYLIWVIGKRAGAEETYAGQEAKIERRVFRLFNIVAAGSLLLYVAAIFFMSVARLISPMPFVLLAFGVLLAAGNFISLISHRSKVNYHFVLIVVVFLVGLVSDPHCVRLQADSGADFGQRMDLRTYLARWMAVPERAHQLQSDSTTEYPVFLVLADGGASRSGYWTALVLSQLDSSTASGAIPFRKHLLCLSGASGGSVGNGAYLAAITRDSAGSASDSIKRLTTDYLGGDFLSYTLARMLGPDIASPVLWKVFGGDRAAALEQSIEASPGSHEMNAAVSRGFSHYLPRPGAGYLPPIVCINTTRMQDGQPGIVSNIELDAVTKRTRIDVLDSLPPGTDMRLSTCMVLGARFPYVSPAGRIGNNYFVDGGYFDNSGAGIVHELLLELRRMQALDTAARSPLKKLRFYVLHITNSPYTADRFERVHAVKNDLLAPLLTLAGSYATQTDVNDTRLNTYIDELYGGQKSHISINLYLKDKKESFPMNWVISRKIREEMQQRVQQPAIDTIIARLNRGRTNIYAGLDEQSAPDSTVVKPMDGR